MKSNALHITRDSIRIFVPLRPLYGVPVYPSVGGDAHIAPLRQVRWCPGGQDHPPYDGTSGTAFSRSTGNHRAAHGRLCFTSIKKTTTLLGGRFGRGRKARTLDTRFWRPLLYQLSYTPIWWAFGDSNPGPDGYEPSALTN